MPDRKKLLLLLLAFFALRLLFGLFDSLIFEEPDYLQTYLIGLKTYTTGTWPWFGPDVNGSENSFKSQIPGALEGLLIGLPFYVLHLPEAPFILLNLLSIAGVALLAWYIHQKLPELPFTWVFIWVAIAPWSIHEATTTINPAYLFLPSILFLVGFMESIPLFTSNIVNPRLANAAMGFSLFWIMQIHFSYVYLVPLAFFSLAVQTLRMRRWNALLFFGLGALPMLALIIPTYVKYGLARGDVASGFAVPFYWGNVVEFWTILARFFSLVSFELPRFLGVSTPIRIQFLTTGHPQLLLPGALLWIGGLLQPFILAAFWFGELRRRFQAMFWAAFGGLCVLLAVGAGGNALKLVGTSIVTMAVILAVGWGLARLKWKKVGPHWWELNLLLTAVFMMVYVSFWFTVKKPLSHIYYVFFPLIMLYSCYCWSAFKNQKYGPLFAKVFLVAGVLFQLGYAIAVAPNHSIYSKWAVMKQAIDQKNYHLLGERRPESLY